MKKRFCAGILCAILLLSAAAPAHGVDGDFGFYGLGTAENVEITPVAASGEAVEAVSRDVDGKEGDETFYPGSCALRVSLSGTEQGAEYLLTVSSGEDVFYADQREGGGVLSFTVSVPLPNEKTDYLLEIGGSPAGFRKIAVSLSFTPEARSAPVKPDQPKPPTPGPVTSPFSDVDPEAWDFEGVCWASENGVMNGVGDGKFDPAAPTSRAMIVTMLYRLEKEPKTDYEISFKDVSENSWYTDPVRWASANGIVGGYSPEQFGPGDDITREQLAAILWRYAAYKGADTSSGEDFNLGVFIDAEFVSPWAWSAMCWAAGSGLITGVGNEHISPGSDASRAQVATILMRYCTKVA